MQKSRLEITRNVIAMNRDLYCTGLSTIPVTENRILVTGSTGYIGKILVDELSARGYRIRAMVRTWTPVLTKQWPDVEIVQADVLKKDELKLALEGIDVAFYLIHSLDLGGGKFMAAEHQAAINFREVAEEKGLKRIIYLGSLGNAAESLSDHLTSRLKVAEELEKGKVLLTFLRAAVIIGRGSTSYEIIRNLITKCPVLLFPTRANSDCQPIAIQDVIKYLVGCLELEVTAGKTYDIGGKDVLSYQSMMKKQATTLGMKRLIIPIFFSTMGIYARIASFITPVKYAIIKSLMESCFYDVVCENSDIKRLIPFEPLSYQQALETAKLQYTQDFDDPEQPTGQENPIHKSLAGIDRPPSRSRGFWSDIYHFLIQRPEIPTLIKFDNEAERENYTFRILQRLGVGVTNYGILNIHKIGVNAPAKYVFEELLKWDGDSTCWPNYIAKVYREDNHLENLEIYFMGWKKKIFKYIKSRAGLLFRLDAIELKTIPDPVDPDNSRYLLYKCSGGYPIGVFTMYVRSSIAEEHEEEASQLFLMVGFNFFGKQKWSTQKLTNRIWESLHNRVTAHVLNRIKQLSEWRFKRIQVGAYGPVPE